MLLTIDVGSSRVKCGMVALDGSLPALGSQLLPPPAAEIDPTRWENALAGALAMIPAKARMTVQAIVISGNGPTLAPVDVAGRPVGPALTWLDQRAGAEAREVAENTTYQLDRSFFLPKALWMARNLPDAYQAARWLVSCPEYLELYLTGDAHTNLTSSGFQRYYWDDAALEAVALDPDKFPPFVHTGNLVGLVLSRVADVLNLPAGVPVFAGASDFVAALLGTATVVEGRTCDRTGSSEGLNHCTSKEIKDPRLICLPHVSSGLFNVGGVISATGSAVKWAADLLHAEGPEEVVKLTEDCDPGAAGLVFLPYLSGERTPYWDSSHRAGMIGWRMQHGRPEMSRAILESAGFALRQVIDIVQEHGCAVVELRASGAQALWAVWNQIKADITGRPLVTTRVADSELIGCACIGYAALGAFASASAAAEAMVSFDRHFAPNPKLASRYADLFEVYLEMSQLSRRVSGVLGG